MQLLYIIVNLSLFAGLALSHEHSYTYETTMDEDAPKPMRILEFTIRNLATEEMFSHADDGLARAHRALRSSEQDPFQVKIRTASDTFDIKVQKQSAADSVFEPDASMFVNRGTYKEKVAIPTMTVLNNPDTFDLLSLQEGGAVTGSVVRNGQAWSVFTDPKDNQLKMVQDGKFQGCSKPLTVPNDGLDPSVGSGGRVLSDKDISEVVQPNGKNMRRRTQNAARWTNCYPNSDKPHKLVIGLALTSTLMQARGNSPSAAATWAGQQLIEANQIYRAQTNIKLTIGAIEMAGPGSNFPWDNPGCNNRNFFSQTGQGMGAQLQAVRRWPKPKANMATWHVMDDCAWKAIELSNGRGFTNGIAYLGTLCNDGAVGVNYCGRDCGTDKPRSRYGTWKVFAHEMGHNFGAWHPFHAHLANPPLIINPRPAQGAAGGIMDYGNGLYQGKFQFNSQVNRNFVCTLLNRVRGQCAARNTLVLDTAAANPGAGATTAKPTPAATTTNAAVSCAAYLNAMVNIGKTNPQNFPGFERTTGVTTAAASVNDYQRYVKCRNLLPQQCQGLQFPRTCSKPACNVCQIVPPGQANKCACSGASSNGQGGRGCTSTDTQPDGSAKAWCYTAKSVCTDGKPSSRVNNADWSYLACQATTKSPAATPAPVAKCADTSGWTDSDGDGCSQYKSCLNGGWKAKDANYYAKWARNGVSARQACCACGKGAPETAGCKDYPGWKNTLGYDCAAYGKYFAACERFGNQADASGVTAKQACCVCKSTLSSGPAASAESVDAVKFENFMNKQRFKDQDPLCLTGLKSDRTCCARECGRCQANGCGTVFSGSSDKCCPGQIKRSCETNPPPCVMGGLVTVTVRNAQGTSPSTVGVDAASDVYGALALLHAGLMSAVVLLLC